MGSQLLAQNLLQSKVSEENPFETCGLIMRRFSLNASLAASLAMLLVGCDTSTSIEPPAKPVEEQAVPMEARKAGVGVGKQGSAMRGDDSLAAKMVTSSAQAYFDTKEKIVFEIEIPRLMQFYKAQDNFSKGPKTHEEFMSKIIKANNVQLPKLPEGMRYQYKPDIEELWVEPIEPAPAPNP